MFKSKIKNTYRKGRNARLYQGDILKDISFSSEDSKNDFQEIFLDFIIILSQDCDLDKDFNHRKDKEKNQDKYLLSILVCPAFDLEDFSKGEHLAGWEQNENWQTQGLNTGEIKKLKNNDEFKRLHYFPAHNDLLFPSLVIDFKHFFTLPRNLIYSQKKTNYLVSLNELFREKLSQRFSNYLSRIGVPEL